MGNILAQRPQGLQTPAYSQLAPVPLTPGQSLPVNPINPGNAGQALTSTLMGFVPPQYANEVSTIGNALQNFGNNLQRNPNDPLAGVLQGNSNGRFQPNYNGGFQGIPNGASAGYLQANPNGTITVNTSDGQSIVLRPDQGRIFLNDPRILNTQNAAYLTIYQGEIALVGNDPNYQNPLILFADANGYVPINYDQTGRVWLTIKQ